MSTVVVVPPAAGLFSAFVIMGVFVPTLQYLVERRFPRKIKTVSETSSAAKSNIAVRQLQRIYHKPRILAPAMLILMVVSLYGASQLEAEFKRLKAELERRDQ